MKINDQSQKLENKTMTAKKTATKKGINSATKVTGDTLNITQNGNKSQVRQHAELALSPIAGNIITANLFAKGMLGEIDLTETYLVMKEEIKKYRMATYRVLRLH